MNKTSRVNTILEEDIIVETSPTISLTSHEIAGEIHDAPRTIFIHMPGPQVESLAERESEEPGNLPITIPAPMFYVEFRPPACWIQDIIGQRPDRMMPIVGMMTKRDLPEVDRELRKPQTTHALFIFIHDRVPHRSKGMVRTEKLMASIHVNEPCFMFNALIINLNERSIFTDSYPRNTDPALLSAITVTENRDPVLHLKIAPGEIAEDNEEICKAAHQYATLAAAVCSHLASPDTIIMPEPMTRQQRRWMIKKNQAPYWHVARPRTDG